jgi:hypothetical protein
MLTYRTPVNVGNLNKRLIFVLKKRFHQPETIPRFDPDNTFVTGVVGLPAIFIEVRHHNVALHLVTLSHCKGPCVCSFCLHNRKCNIVCMLVLFLPCANMGNL